MSPPWHRDCRPSHLGRAGKGSERKDYADQHQTARLTEEGKPFSLFGFKNYMARLGDRFEEAGVANWMAHRSRHYWATSAHRAGMTVFDIAVEGGWRDLKMVQRYTKSRPFEELQRLPTPLSFVLQKRA